MKINFSLIIMFISIALNAQDTASSKSFVFLNNQLDCEDSMKSIKIFTEARIESNSLNTSMYNDFLFNSEFKDKSKEAFLTNNKTRTNVFVSTRGYTEYKLSKTTILYGKYIRQSAYKGNSDFTKLMIFGNSNYSNQKVSSGSFDYLQGSSASFGIVKMKKVSNKISGSLGIGLNTLLDYNKFVADELSLYTSARGEYLDVQVSGAEILKGESKSPIGAGVDFNSDISYKPTSKTYVRLKLKDFNYNLLFNPKNSKIDTNFIYSGYSFSLFDQQSSFSEYIDTNLVQIIDRKKGGKKLGALPNRVELILNHKISNNTELTVQAFARDFGKYGYGGNLSVSNIIHSNLKLQTSLEFGNFSGLVLSESIEFVLKNKINIYASFYGLQSLVLPQNTNSYGLVFGLFRTLHP